jgi:hypothetical protein
MTRLSLLLVLLVASLGFSCVSHGPTLFAYVDSPSPRIETPQRVIPIWIDKDFGAADDVAIQDALDQWSYALNGYIQFDVKSTQFNMSQDSVLRDVQTGKAWVFLKVDSQNEFIKHQDTSNGRQMHIVLACADQIGGHTLYVVRDRITNSQVTGIIMHEVGHLLGANHVPGSLMAPAFEEDSTRCVDLITLQQVAYYQHLDYHRMNYCVYSAESQKLREGQ